MGEDKRDNWVSHEIKEITFYIIFGLVMSVIIPVFIGFSLGAFEESFVIGKPLEFGSFLVSYIIYYIIIVVGLIGLPTLKIREMFVTKKGEHPANQSKPDIFSVGIIHDPEQDGLLYNTFNYIGYPNLMSWSLSILRMFVIGLLVFGAIGILQISTNFSFVDVPELGLPQQVTPFGDVFFSAEPASFAETTMLIFVFSLLMSLNGYICSKLRLTKLGYFTLGILICFVIGFLWMGFHYLVYGNSEAKLQATFIFGTVGSFLTLVFGTFILWYIWHLMNNIFVKLGRLAIGSEDIVFISVIIWAGVLILWISSEVLIWKFKKRKANLPEVPK